MKEKVLIVEDAFEEASLLCSMLERAGYPVCGIARSVAKAVELVVREKPGLVLLDIILAERGTCIDLVRQMKEQNIAFVYLSSSSDEQVLTQAKATEPDGFLVKPFREKDLLVTLEIARYRHEHSLESKYRREEALQEQLQSFVGDGSDWEQKVLAIGKALQPHISFDCLSIGFRPAIEGGHRGITFLRVGFDEYQTIGVSELAVITRLKKHELELLPVIEAGITQATLYTKYTFDKSRQTTSLTKLLIDTFQMESCLFFPLQMSTGQSIIFSFFSRRAEFYNTDHIELLIRLQQALTKSMAMILGIDRMDEAAEKTGESGAIEYGPDPLTSGFGGIIGKSHLLLNVFDNITQIAPTDTSVLILGESGTGKEMIAGCIHRLSLRREQRLVKVNCAAIPPNLIESELFGHEKGAFTDAIDRRIGKFEQADKGTIFLDEIGEMPLDLQAKLLHALQDREIERIGSKAPIKIDVRIIAATNRNLEKEVAEGRFRLDLYYRLNVIPFSLPPLRDRKEDIMDLANYFIVLYNRKAGKKVTGFSEKAIRSIMTYRWPGNIRELEHMIERCVLLSKGAIIEDVPVMGNLKKDAEPADAPIKTIQENERDHIVSVLKKCKGKIWGPGAAADLLNLPPTTLRSKMKRLGIDKD
ncbi:MAG: sigma-54-dependent Fis family transcriptional regulator [Bacteroidetes bacterium]|nr:sigma-54-dependent Fis family transcriptional regulator [Bacteroidota bacterium]